MKRLVLCMVVVLAASIARATGYVTVGDFKFFVDTYAGEASVAKYVGDGGDVVVPASVKVDGVSYPVTSLGEKCFSECEGLKSIVISSPKLVDIGSACFSKCNNLLSVKITAPVKSLGNDCFSGCKSLSSVQIPSSVTSLGNYCFYSCSSLISFQIPSSVTSLGASCFEDCFNLSSIHIPSSVRTIGYKCFRWCSSLSSLNIPESVKDLRPDCFMYCVNLKSAIISANIEDLESGLFGYCSELESLTLSEYVKDCPYPNSTFRFCKSLSEIKAYSVDPIAFGNDIPSNCVLVVPAESVEAYQKVNPGRKVYPLKGNDLGTGKQCGLPVVSYASGQLKFSCSTPGANYHYKIVASDACDQTYSQDGIVKLSAKYDISVYATAEGYIPSETVDATLVWLDAKVKGTGVSSISVPDKRAVITSAHDGVLTVSGLDEGEEVAFYSVDGKRIGGQKAVDGVASQLIPNIATSNIVIVRVGEQSIKVMMK